MQTKKTNCYIKNETIASRGTNEVASYMFSYLEEKAKNLEKNIGMLCDNCAPQSKNRFFITMIWNALHKSKFN